MPEHIRGRPSVGMAVGRRRVVSDRRGDLAGESRSVGAVARHFKEICLTAAKRDVPSILSAPKKCRDMTRRTSKVQRRTAGNAPSVAQIACLSLLPPFTCNRDSRPPVAWSNDAAPLLPEIQQGSGPGCAPTSIRHTEQGMLLGDQRLRLETEIGQYGLIPSFGREEEPCHPQDRSPSGSVNSRPANRRPPRSCGSGTSAGWWGWPA